MERETVHSLTAAYALDALDPSEAAAYEAHLAQCEECRAELRELQASASSMAYALDAQAPPPGLRDRILVQARSERSNVVPLPSRRAFRVAAAAAAVAASAAIGLGVWAASLSSELDDRAAAPSEEALAVLADPDASHVALEGADGTLVVAPSGEAVLLLQDLEQLDEGRYYTAWVIEDAESVLHAGAFAADDATEVVILTEPVPDGAVVGVTIEDRPDAEAPSSNPMITSEPA